MRITIQENGKVIAIDTDELNVANQQIVFREAVPQEVEEFTERIVKPKPKLKSREKAYKRAYYLKHKAKWKAYHKKSKTSKKYWRSGCFWTIEEKKKLLDLKAQGLKPSKIGLALGRRSLSIRVALRNAAKKEGWITKTNDMRGKVRNK